MEIRFDLSFEDIELQQALALTQFKSDMFSSRYLSFLRIIIPLSIALTFGEMIGFFSKYSGEITHDFLWVFCPFILAATLLMVFERIYKKQILILRKKRLEPFPIFYTLTLSDTALTLESRFGKSVYPLSFLTNCKILQNHICVWLGAVAIAIPLKAFATPADLSAFQTKISLHVPTT